MDIQMSGIDGLEAVRIIKADSTTNKIPIIALTALAIAGNK
jgi:two-component system cell cycle response regulator DivK